MPDRENKNALDIKVLQTQVLNIEESIKKLNKTNNDRFDRVESKADNHEFRDNERHLSLRDLINEKHLETMNLINKNEITRLKEAMKQGAKVGGVSGTITAVIVGVIAYFIQ